MPEECGDGQWTKRIVFRFTELQETAGAHTNMETSKAETDTPVGTLTTKDPDTLKQGVIKRIHMRVNFANAVTLEAIRFYAGAKAGDYESSSLKLFDSIGDYPAGLVDDDEYDIEVNIPFKLVEEGKIYFAPQWSGACGNLQFYLELSGETFE